MPDPCTNPTGCPHGAMRPYYCRDACASAAHPLTAPQPEPTRVPAVEDYAAIRRAMRTTPPAST